MKSTNVRWGDGRREGLPGFLPGVGSEVSSQAGSLGQPTLLGQPMRLGPAVPLGQAAPSKQALRSGRAAPSLRLSPSGPGALPLSLRLARTGLAMYAGLAPGRAAKAASRMFCRPARNRRPDHEVEQLNSATPFRFRQGRVWVKGWRWGSEGPLALLVHGWAGRGGQLAAFAGPLVQRGFQVVTWDGLGHGDTAGKSSSMFELADGLFAVTRHLRQEPKAVVAHSMGSQAVALAMAEGLEFERAAWISPPAGLARYVEAYREWLGFDVEFGRRMVADMNRRYAVNLDDYEIELLGVKGGERVLILHDEGDREVPIAEGRQVAKAIGAARLVSTSDLGHRRILCDAGVIEEVGGWLARAAWSSGSPKAGG